jgi:hypothetical protein
MNEVKQTADPDADATPIRRFYEEVLDRGHVGFADLYRRLAVIPPAGAGSAAP